MIEGIIAINKIGCIGKNGKLPWSSKQDLKHFQSLTMGKIVVVGRKTAEHLPKLKGRTVIIASSKNPLDKILKEHKDLIIIGGREIYTKTLHLCSVIHVSRINDSSIGDTYYEIPDELKDRVINYEFETD